MWTIRTLNPDGVAARRRGNAHGVDLNRNFAWNWKAIPSSSGETLIPCERRGRDVALRYARLSGLRPRDCFPSPPGSATGYQGHRLGQRAFVVELPGRALRAAEVRRHARAVSEIAEPG